MIQALNVIEGPSFALAGGDLLRELRDAVPDVAGAWGALVFTRDDVVVMHGDEDASQGPATRVVRDNSGWRLLRGWRWRREGPAVVAHPPAS